MELKLTHAQTVNRHGSLIMKQKFECKNGSNYYLYFKYYMDEVYMLKVKDMRLVQCTNLTKEGKRAYELGSANSFVGN
jgi:hypothetical protein